VSIARDTGAILADNRARNLHAGQNRGPMLSVGYQCEDGCRGRIELREHKGHLFASLHNQPRWDPKISGDHACSANEVTRDPVRSTLHRRRSHTRMRAHDPGVGVRVYVHK
jgi:hypothetical protein